MTYHITYLCQLNNEQRTLEWVAPEGWSPATIREHFTQRFPGTETVCIEAQP